MARRVFYSFNFDEDAWRGRSMKAVNIHSARDLRIGEAAMPVLVVQRPSIISGSDEAALSRPFAPFSGVFPAMSSSL